MRVFLQLQNPVELLSISQKKIIIMKKLSFIIINLIVSSGAIFLYLFIRKLEVNMPIFITTLLISHLSFMTISKYLIGKKSIMFVIQIFISFLIAGISYYFLDYFI